MRPVLKNGSQQQIILQHQLRHRSGPIPAVSELKMPRDLCCKKPKLSLKMLTLLKTTPVLLDAPARVQKVGRGLLPRRFSSEEKTRLQLAALWLNLSEHTWVNLAERQSNA